MNMTISVPPHEYSEPSSSRDPSQIRLPTPEEDLKELEKAVELAAGSPKASSK
jgi:hypothetical protein